ncbi:hypothetical protein [Planctomicrobium sp. SH527]|uniref:hypothetical protein n=1 Tax=Planctomicrobium sp. SH527 TaxID=3448123 RepID=UPI003F5B3402
MRCTAALLEVSGWDITGAAMQMLSQIRNHRLMRQGIASTLLLLAFLVVIDTAQAEVIYSKSRRFRIPFQFDSQQLTRIGANEVRLYVSQDNANWSNGGTVSPSDGRFTFEAPADGSYWFSVKTVIGNNKEIPAGPPTSSLHVIVDTEPPQVELKLEEVELGRSRLTWIVVDPTVDLNSLNVEYLEPESQVWQSVSVRSQDRGQLSWTTEATGTMQARARVSDLAGNVTEATASTFIANRPNRENERPDVGKPVATDPERMNTIGANSPSSILPVVPQLTSVPSGKVPVLATNLPLLESPPKLPTAAPSATLLVDSQSPSLSLTPPLVSPVAPTASPTANSASKPSGHLVNSLIFRIAYSLQEVGPSGVGRVDLYVTEDGGKQWFHYGNDPDKVSPMDVSVPHDGDYGFAFRVTNGLGRADMPPQPGTAPEVTITVDRTPPVGKLFPVVAVGPIERNEVTISWAAQDRNLGDRPIALFYSTSSTGPWLPIHDWLANSGQVAWTIPSTVTNSFYVRMDVRDAAGNIARVYGETPYLIDRSLPRARVTDVESLAIPVN